MNTYSMLISLLKEYKI